METADRCYEKVMIADLRRLAQIATADRELLFRRNDRLRRLYEDRVLCIALCQGAALHVVDGRNGIKDWDVWTFFRMHPEAPFPPRRRVEREFGDPRFGRSIIRSEYLGRCVDLLGRAIECPEGVDPAAAIRRYLRQGRTASAKALADKAVVLVDPEERCGDIVWPIGAEARGLIR